MASLADILEQYRNWKGVQDWNLGRQEDQMLGHSEQARGLWDLLQGVGVGDMGMAGVIKPTVYELAHETARKNAVDMLGLPENNTAMDRARALGFDVDAYHGTNKDFPYFDVGKSSKSAAFGPGVYITYEPSKAAGWSKSESGANVMPLKVKRQNVLPLAELNDDDAKKLSGYLGREIKSGSHVPYFSLENRGGSIAGGALNAGFDGVDHAGPGGHGLNTVFMNPSSIRSRFAAFDPARAHESDLLASRLLPWATGGMLGYSLMNSDDSMASEGGRNRGLMGLYR